MHSSFTIENHFPYHQQLKSHCQKCGRRNRKHNRRVKSKQHPFPNEYPIGSQTNDNHSISKNIFSRNSSRKSNKKNIIIDQLIQVQQLNPTRNHSYDYKKNEYQRLTNPINSDRLKQVQQMIYLRENINNLTYREIHFSNQYIILKRLEEKNNLINQNRFNVDQYFHSLKLQYQTISTLFQSIPITLFTYSKQDSYQSDLTIKTSENPTEQSFPTIDKSTRTDSPIFITPYKHQQYSQNVNQSYINIDNLTENKQQYLKFDTAVIIDVKKCPQMTHTIPNQYSQFQQPQIMCFPWSQNSNSIFYHPIYNESISNIPHETTWFPPNIAHQFLTPNPSSPTDNDTTSPTSISNKNTNQSIKYKIKQIINILKKNLFNLSNKIDKSISTTMTSDSLITTTYSVSSTLPILNKNISQLSYTKSIINVELDSLNNNYYSDRTIRNSAKNINYNQQRVDDDETQNSTQSRMSISRRITVQYMSPSFMFVLQILLVICLMDRILMYCFFGIMPSDTFVSIIVDNTQSINPISSEFIREIEQNDEKFNNLLLSFFKFV